jgi:mevalonate pyrophosphate decarboxylase
VLFRRLGSSSSNYRTLVSDLSTPTGAVAGASAAAAAAAAAHVRCGGALNRRVNYHPLKRGFR